MTLSFDEEGGLDPIDEGDLAILLRAGFECAPVVQPDAVESLKDDLQSLVDEVLAELVRPAPKEEVISAACHEVVDETHRQMIKWFQQEVRSRLS
jgi:hypothetical protein